MPTVYLPLGSQAASGTIGKMLVFQGVTVRSWVIPKDDPTDEQLDLRHLFADTGKMLKTLGLLARAYEKWVLGSRWHSVITGAVLSDQMGWRSAALVVWNACSSDDQTAWRSNAPTAATYDDCGWIYFMCVWVIDALNIEVRNGDFLFDVPEGDSSALFLANWNQDLSGVLDIGTWDERDSHVLFGGDYSLVVDSNAYGGGYTKLPSGHGAQASFYFVGRRFRLYFKAGPAFVRASVQIWGIEVGPVQEYAATNVYNSVWSSDALASGLYFVVVQAYESGAINLDAIEIDGTVPAAPKAASPAALVGVGAYRQVQLDFGSAWVYNADFTVAVSDAQTGQKVIVYQAGDGVNGGDADENEMDFFNVRAVATDGYIKFFCDAMDGPVIGAYVFNFVIG